MRRNARASELRGCKTYGRKWGYPSLQPWGKARLHDNSKVMQHFRGCQVIFYGRGSTRRISVFGQVGGAGVGEEQVPALVAPEGVQTQQGFVHGRTSELLGAFEPALILRAGRLHHPAPQCHGVELFVHSVRPRAPSHKAPLADHWPPSAVQPRRSRRNTVPVHTRCHRWGSSPRRRHRAVWPHASRSRGGQASSSTIIG